jgi:hypothetical protein
MTEAMATTWVKSPGSAAAERWLTRPGCRTVLVVIPHMTAGTRLLDVLPLLEADHRIQVLFTIPATSDAWHGVEDYVRGWDGLVLPWHQVLRMRFDLVLSSSYTEIDKLAAPVVVIPHGTSGNRCRVSPLPWTGRGMLVPDHPRDLLVRDGRVVPAAVVVAHEEDARQLREACPEAGSRIVVAGDVCLDRMRASVPFRDRYREAFGVGPDQKLVVVSSTWSRHSLFGSNLELISKLLAQLPSRVYRVVAAFHPLLWAAHAPRQIRAWLSADTKAGLVLLPPEEGWRAALVAADYVVGDQGSVTRYAAGLGIPTLLNPQSVHDVRPGSLAALLSRLAPAVRVGKPLREQLVAAAVEHSADRYAALAGRLTSLPGRSGQVLRERMYQIIGIPEPEHRVPISPVPLPPVGSGPADPGKCGHGC